MGKSRPTGQGIKMRDEATRKIEIVFVDERNVNGPWDGRTWGTAFLTVQEGLDELASVCAMEVNVGGTASANKIPQPRPSVQQLLDAASVRLPDVLPCKGIKVASRKKLQENRLTR